MRKIRKSNRYRGPGPLLVKRLVTKLRVSSIIQPIVACLLSKNTCRHHPTALPTTAASTPIVSPMKTTGLRPGLPSDAGFQSPRTSDKKPRNSLNCHTTADGSTSNKNRKGCEIPVRKSPRCTESHVTLSTSRDLQKRWKKGREKKKKIKEKERERRAAGQSREKNRSAIHCRRRGTSLLPKGMAGKRKTPRDPETLRFKIDIDLSPCKSWSGNADFFRSYRPPE